MGEKLIEIVDVFRCCIFTPRILTTVVPAFFLAAAITVFVPRAAVLRYLGPRARRSTAYVISALSGVLLSVCSCNVVPLFLSIYRQGAGIGPAFTFLYAGPAINVVSLIFVFQVIGWRIGLWRAVAVPVMASAIGLIAAWIWRREEAQRHEQIAKAEVADSPNGGMPELTPGELPRAALVAGLLLALVVVGSIHMPWTTTAAVMIPLFALCLLAIWRVGGREGFVEWLAETWELAKLVFPALIPAILAIGALATYIDVKWVYALVGNNDLKSIFAASVFGALMYFPILSEVAFAKAFLRLGMATGPALATLLTGAGLSLPGAIVLGRVIGWRKVAGYLSVVVVLTTAVALLFAWQVGDYLCPCVLEGHH